MGNLALDLHAVVAGQFSVVSDNSSFIKHPSIVLSWHRYLLSLNRGDGIPAEGSQFI